MLYSNAIPIVQLLPGKSRRRHGVEISHFRSYSDLMDGILPIKSGDNGPNGEGG